MTGTAKSPVVATLPSDPTPFPADGGGLDVADEEKPSPGAFAASTVRAVHAALERMARRGIASDEAAVWVAGTFGIEERAGTIATLARQMYAIPAVRDA